MDDESGCPPPPDWVTLDWSQHRLKETPVAEDRPEPPDLDEDELDADMDALDLEPDLTGSWTAAPRQPVAPPPLPPQSDEPRVRVGSAAAARAFLARVEGRSRPAEEGPPPPPAPRDASWAESTTPSPRLTPRDKDVIATIEARLRAADEGMLRSCAVDDDVGDEGEWAPLDASDLPSEPPAAPAPTETPPAPPRDAS